MTFNDTEPEPRPHDLLAWPGGTHCNAISKMHTLVGQMVIEAAAQESERERGGERESERDRERNREEREREREREKERVCVFETAYHSFFSVYP